MRVIHRSLAVVVVMAALALSTACSNNNSTSPGLPPDAPANVSAAGGNTIVTLTWNLPSGPTSYNVYWKTSAGVGTGDAVIAGVTSPYTHTGLTGETTYYYVVTAVNDAGESETSAEVSAMSGPVNVYVNGDSGDDSNDGSMGSPKLTIPAAIQVAAGLTGTVHVAERTTAPYDRAVVLADGVNLRGGYNADFSINDPSTYVTEIFKTAASVIDGVDTDSLTIEGFTVRAADIGTTNVVQS
jgi:hypothetical protein